MRPLSDFGSVPHRPWVPAVARVEIEAKIAAGYFTDGAVPSNADLALVKGRGLE